MKTKIFISFFSVCLLILLGCSNASNEESALTTQPPTTTASPPTTQAVTTTVAPSTTQPPTTMAPVVPYDGYVSDLYSDEEVWLCWPENVEDVCARDQTATAIYADGTLETIPFEKAVDPDVDCFYVYPTTSGDRTK